MKIREKAYAAIDYTLSLDSGEVVDRSEPDEPLGFIVGTGQIIPGLEDALDGMEAGEKTRVVVEADRAYGETDPGLFRDIPRENFPADVSIEPGMAFEARGPHGPVSFRVRSVTDETVVADFNHPLAGKRLHFEVTVAEVREPRAEELAALAKQHACTPHDCGGCGGSCG